MSKRLMSTRHSIRPHDMTIRLRPAAAPTIDVHILGDGEEDQIITLELWDGPPTPPSPEDPPVTWESSSPQHIPTGELGLEGSRGPTDNIFAVPSGHYHMRLCSQDRDHRVQLWPDHAEKPQSTAAVLVAAGTQIATTGHGMFGFFDEQGDFSERQAEQEWYSATNGSVDIFPACELPEPGLRFELWSALPPGDDLTNAGDAPEVQAHLAFRVTGEGSIGLMAIATGADPGVFTLPPGSYHLHLLGYRRSIMADLEEDLKAQNIDVGDDEWQRAEGTELYVARFWPV